MDGLLKGRMSSKNQLMVLLTCLILSIIALFVVACSSNEKSQEELHIDFQTEAYKEYQPYLTEPQHFSEEQKAEYSDYHPSVIKVIDLYSEEGLEPALSYLIDRLAHSQDAVELLEMHRTLLQESMYFPSLLLRDPQTALQVFESAPEGTEDERAAKEYLIALTYAWGDFYKAVLTDEEYAALKDHSDRTIEETADSRNNAISDKGKEDLAGVFEDFPRTRISLLARDDYAGYTKMKMKPSFDLDQKNLAVALEEYPDTAFVTAAYLSLAASYRNAGDYESALERYEESLAYPDFRTNTPGKTAHDAASNQIERIQDKYLTE